MSYKHGEKLGARNLLDRSSGLNKKKIDQSFERKRAPDED